MKFIQVTTNYPDKVGCPVKLYNVRRGQLVYYANRLYKVYAVNPFFKRSIHLYRLADLKQYVATAKEIDLYHPKHFDHFIYNHRSEEHTSELQSRGHLVRRLLLETKKHT